MKKWILLVVILFSLTILSGCGQKKYRLSETVEDIETIHIIYVSPYKFVSMEELLNAEPIVSISGDDIAPFLDELLSLPCYSFFMDPTECIIGYTIRIHYLDGTVEWICSESGRYEDKDRFVWKHIMFEEKGFGELIQKVIAEDEEG